MGVADGDVRSMIDSKEMTFVQYTTILICFLMNMLDGMDVLVIAFTANAITTEWAISPASLGIVLSAAVAGMTVGALLLAPQADRLGRKKMILFCATLMGTSIYATSLADSINQLMVLRFVSGLGIGGMLASSSTLASEYAPGKSKDFWVSLVMSGYPIGAVLTGLAASYIIPEFGWRAMFQFAGITTLITLPLIIFFLSPSLEFLVKKKPPGALEKVNKILRKMDLAPLDTLPVPEKSEAYTSIGSLFNFGRMQSTLLLWLAFFMAFATLYFLLSWIPKLTTMAGLSEQLGIYSGTVFNLGSFIGILVLGGMSMKLGLRKTIFYFLTMAAILMIMFGLVTGSFMVLVMFGLIGFTMHGGFVGLYPLAARLYPVGIRSTGIGWALGAGRAGAILGPILAGFLVNAGLSLTINFIIFAIPCFIAGIAAISIRKDMLG